MYGLLKKNDPDVRAADFITRSAFKEMDTDRDGRVAREEFVAACLGEKQFISLLSFTAKELFYEEEEDTTTTHHPYNSAQD